MEKLLEKKNFPNLLKSLDSDLPTISSKSDSINIPHLIVLDFEKTQVELQYSYLK